MGYRSDVMFVIKGTEEEVLTAWAEFRFKNPFTNSSIKDPCIEHMSITTSGLYAAIVFKAEQWKWYAGYTDVDRLERLWTFFEDRSSTANCLIGRFCRIGEDEEDNENRAFGENCYEINLGIERSIYCDDRVDHENDVRSKL